MATAPSVVACVCGRRFQAPPHLAGRRVPCPGCGQSIDIPASSCSLLDSAALAMHALPQTTGSPLGIPAATRAQPTHPASGLSPRGWIALCAGGGLLLLVVVGLFVVVSVGQRLFARNRALAAQLQAGQAAAPADGPHVYESPTGRFSVEFPGRPKQEFVLSEQRGGLSQWEASFTRGNFAGGQGEQFLCTHLPIGLPPTDEQATARIAALVDATANVGERQGRVLTSRELSEPGVRGREVTYEWTSAHGGRVAGRYRVLLTDREWISLDWVAAPAQPERPEVQRFFDSLEWKKKPMP